MSGGVIKAGKFEVWQECDANTLICTWVQKSETPRENDNVHLRKKIDMNLFLNLTFYLFIWICLVSYILFYIIKFYLINYCIYFILFLKK